MNWERVEELFELAGAQPPERRRQFLAQSCGQDLELRDELEAMLAGGGDERALAVERFIVDRPLEACRPDPLLGRCLGPWRLLSAVGSGGMGTVYRAERADGHYRQEVAIKLVRSGPRDAHAIERFRTERHVLARLVHPNIAALVDGGFASDGTPYLVMELVDGVPITEWCVAERLSLDARLRLFRVVCEAVQHAHRALVVHRDLKPSNIFVSRDGNVKLLDFGIAKLLDPDAWDMDSTSTRAELRLVTPAYGAPEQRHGGAITTATDVYALGVLLYELLTGARPADSSTTGTSPLAAATPAPIVAPSDALRRARSTASGANDGRTLARRVRGDLDRIVLMALREEAERRYASAGQLAEEITRFLDGRAVLAQPDTVGYRARKFVGRNRLAVTAAAVALTCISVFAIVATQQARALAGQTRVARVEQATAEQVVRVLVDLFETTNPAIRPDGDRMPVRELLGGAEARALAQLSGTPVVKAKLQQVFGLIHSQRGEYARAREMLQAALDDQRRLVGSDHPEALATLQALGRLLYTAGDDERARRLLEESLARHRRVYGEEHEKTAAALFALAPLAPDLDAAGVLLTRALEVRQRVLAQGHPDVARSLGALAQYHNRRGDRERSRALYRQALAGFGADIRNTTALGLMNDYAVLLGEMNLHAEAEAMQRQAIAVGGEVLGPNTLPVANLTNNLAVTLTSVGRLAEAERAFREAYAQHLALFGERHWRTRNLARNVGRILALQQQYQEGLTWMDRALAFQAGDDDAAHEVIRAQRAWILFRLGRRAEALNQAGNAVHTLERMTREDSGQSLAMSRPLLARMLNEVGRARDAEPLARAAMQWLERWGATYPRHAEAACELGRAQLLQGMTAEGRAVLERCLPVYRAWGQAERDVVQSLDRLLANSVRRAQGNAR